MGKYNEELRQVLQKLLCLIYFMKTGEQLRGFVFGFGFGFVFVCLFGLDISGDNALLKMSSSSC